MRHHLRYWWLVLCRWVGIVTHPWDRWRRHAIDINEIIARFEIDPDMRRRMEEARRRVWAEYEDRSR